MKLNELLVVIDLLNVLVEVRFRGVKLDNWFECSELCEVVGEIEIVDKHHIIINVNKE